MSGTPIGETAKDRRRQWFVGIVAVVALLAILGNVVLGAALIKITDDDHTSQLAQQQHIVRLEQQHGADIQNSAQLLKNIKAADKVLAKFAISLINTENAICAKVGCGTPIPPLFTLTPTTTAPRAPASPPAPATPRVAPGATVTTVPQGPGHSRSAPGHTKHH